MFSLKFAAYVPQRKYPKHFHITFLFSVNIFKDYFSNTKFKYSEKYLIIFVPVYGNLKF